MSGGIGPSNDIRLPKEEQYQTIKSSSSPPRPLLTFRQLNMLAIIVVLAASGLVSAGDIAFVIFSLIYMYFLSRVAFPSLSSQSDPPPSVFAEQKRILGIYVLFSAVISLFLPIIYIFEGIFEEDKEGMKAAAPHLFLLASQVFAEGVSFNGGFSLPIRVFVPVFYNSRRIFTIVDWLRSEIYKEEFEYGGSWRRLYVGRALAVANMAFWCFNLFGFLLPVYLPKAFKIYYSSRNSKD